MQTKEFAAKQARLEHIVREKDMYLAEFRDQARAITSELEEHLAEARVQAQIEGMSPDERQAMLDGLQGEG